MPSIDHMLQPYQVSLDLLENEDRMQDDKLPVALQKRIEELRELESSYWEDELYSFEALTNPQYRDELERRFKLDPLGPLPPRM